MGSVAFRESIEKFLMKEEEWQVPVLVTFLLKGNFQANPEY